VCARTLRRPLARDLRPGARHLRAHRAREVRALQPPGRHRGAALRRRAGDPAAGHARRLEGLCRQRHAGRGAGLRHRRHAAALHGRGGGQRLLQQGQREHRRRHADQRQRQPADGARHARCSARSSRRPSSAAAGRHDVPERAAGRLQPVGRGHRAEPDGADFEADPLGPRYRLRGHKMWISAGEHELTENIVHLVLAKIPGPDGKPVPGTRASRCSSCRRSWWTTEGG
jgi:hypothetical protein